MNNIWAKLKKIILINIFLFLVFTPHLTKVNADVGLPPINPHGGTIKTGALQTNVKMASENVTLTYGSPINEYWEHSGELSGRRMDCHVSAVFKLENTGNQDENLQVFFPASDIAFVTGDHVPMAGEEGIKNFKVNGTVLGEANFTQDMEVLIKGEKKTIPAYQWNENFLANTSRDLVIEYDTKSSKNYEVFYITYVLGTGRSWLGPIGKGEIKFVFPENLVSYSIAVPPTIEGDGLSMTSSDNSVLFTFQNYEPKDDEIIYFEIYDFDKVRELEQKRKEADSFFEYLVVADKAKYLSSGIKCNLCKGGVVDIGKEYYQKAVQASASKENLLYVLESLVFWQKDGIESLRNIEEGELYKRGMEKDFGMSPCEGIVEGKACKERIFEFDYELGLFHTPIRASDGEVQNKDLLTQITKRMEDFDTVLAQGIYDYIAYGEGKESAPISPNPTKVDEAKEEDTTVASTDKQSTADKLILPLGILAGVSTLTLLLVLLRNSKLVQIITPRFLSKQIKKPDGEIMSGKNVLSEIDTTNPSHVSKEEKDSQEISNSST
jgi:hypothetical protein